MHAVIPHRGPDGEGFVVVGDRGTVTHTDVGGELHREPKPRVGFAFRRLKICDLSDAAGQPMGSADARTWLAFNGEIYNFRELRRELEGMGRVFRTQGDTEVALAAYEHWGEGCFARFEGMWALAVIDLRRNCLVVSRDRFGIKPLFWTMAGGGMLFASEVKQLLAVAKGVRSNRPLIEMYLRGRRYPALDETFFEGIRAMPPAAWCAIDLSAPREPRFRRYWNLADFTSDHNDLRYEEAVSRVENVLARAVESHRRADVKVGALLSGGLDSAVIVALAHRHGGARLPTFSLGYREAAPQSCEMRFVDAMAKRDRIENHETTLNARWVADNTDRALWALEEPPLAMPALAQYRVFQLCAAHGATVVLDGQGADEIVAGYHYHQHALIRERLLAFRPLTALAELRAIARREGRSAAGLFSDHFIRPRLRSRSSYEWIAAGGPRSNAGEFEAARSDFGRDASSLNRQLYFDVRWGNVKIVLGYGDRNAMAHSVEARVPYFDRAFVELLFSLPDTYKIGNGDRKRVLRDVARRYVPSEITERSDRMGYGTPDGEMIRGALRETVDAAINDPAFHAAGWIAPSAATRFALDFHKGLHHDYRALWRLFALSRWAAQFSVRT
jgi:asparagine synthase (glutamine-hydrolysing)